MQSRGTDLRKMLRDIAVVVAVTAGWAAVPAFAMTSPGENDMRPGAVSGEVTRDLLRLAQSGDVEIYIDEYGRRVIVDAWSGEIIAIQPQRRQQVRRPLRERRAVEEERFYLDDPDDMRRLRQLRRYEDGTAMEAYPRRRERYLEPEYAPEEFPGAPDDYRRRRPVTGAEVAPEAIPEDDVDDGFEEPRTATRDPIQRKPLDTAPREPATQEAMIEPETTPGETIVEQPGKPAGSMVPPPGLGGREEVAALQILLDRAGASPGVIDGKFGSNVDKALTAYTQLKGTVLRSTDAAGIKEALAATGGDPFTTYTITATDAAGPYVASVPADYGEKAKLERMSFTSVSEMLAERFHMDEGYLKTLNPGANFGRPGTVIKVANIGVNISTPVVRIVADKGRKQVRAYDAAGKLVALYPATIGSADTPSPSGNHTVARIALNPEYTYNPKLNFKQGNNDKVLTIPPGPNGPVGSVWIALSKPTYGIHGTPEPSKIGKTESNGCVRLTNWDAQELAKVVKEGVAVEFVE